MDDVLDDVLAHYGVRGMKWGVRRADPSSSGGSSSGTTKKPKEVSDDAAAARTAKAKSKSQGLDALSNKELQHLVNRMNLEQQYSRLTSHEGTLKTGVRAGKKVLGAGKTVADVYNTINSPAFKALNMALKKKSAK